MRMDDERKAMEEVMGGCEFAKQLRQVLLNNDNNNELTTTISLAKHLVNKVINSFNNTLFLLEKHIPSIGPTRSMDFKKSCKSTSTPKGYYQRR